MDSNFSCLSSLVLQMICKDIYILIAFLCCNNNNNNCCINFPFNHPPIRLLARNCLTLIIILTSPMHSKAVQSLDVKQLKFKKRKDGSSTEELEVSESVDRKNSTRSNALEQVSARLRIKEAMLEGGIFQSVLSLIVEPLRMQYLDMKWDTKENQAFERFFLFIRNMLAISSCPMSTSEDFFNAQIVHNKLLTMLEGPFLSIIAEACASMRQDRYQPWINVIVHIIFHILRGREAKDLFKIWKSGTLPKMTLEGLTEMSIGTSQETTNYSAAKATDILPGRKIPALSLEKLKNTDLSAKLARERNCRVAFKANQNRFCGAIYAKNPILGNKENSDSRSSSSSSSSSAKPAPKASAYVRNPFVDLTSNLPQARRRRQKANITFTCDDANSVASINTSFKLCDPNETHAGIVVASFVETMVRHGFLEVAWGVKNVWRRDLTKMMPNDDQIFFQIATFFSKYRRMQLAEEHERHIKQSAGSPWVPDVSALLQCMDRMTYLRTIAAMATYKQKKEFDNILHPMELFKEIIGSVRFLMTSSEFGHHIIALGTLHRIFHIGTEREDPLPGLLRDWRPGTYSRRHLFVLIELVHETLKTLDESKSLFGPNYLTSQKASQGGLEFDSTVNQYMADALKFDPDDYFRRLLTNSAVVLYTRVLEYYQENPPAINHYVYMFLRRICTQKIEPDLSSSDDQDEDYDSNSNRKNKGNSMTSSGVEGSEPTLGFMLFNINTFIVFSSILNDPLVCRQEQMQPLVRLIKSVIHSFGEAAKTNRLLYAEILFQHPSSHKFCQTIHNVYDAKNFAVLSTQRLSEEAEFDGSDSDDDSILSGRSDDEGTGSGRRGDERDSNHDAERLKKKMARAEEAKLKALLKPKDAIALVNRLQYNNKKNIPGGREQDSDGDVEFDENDLSSAFVAAPKPKSTKTKKKDKAEKKRIKKNSKRVLSDSENEEDEASLGGKSDGRDSSVQQSSDEEDSDAESLIVNRVSKSKNFSEAEDNILKEKYPLYADTNSVYDMLAQEPELIALGNNRTAVQIQRRVKHLRLMTRPATYYKGAKPIKPFEDSPESDSRSLENSPIATKSDVDDDSPRRSVGEDGEADGVDVGATIGSSEKPFWEADDEEPDARQKKSRLAAVGEGFSAGRPRKLQKVKIQVLVLSPTDPLTHSLSH